MKMGSEVTSLLEDQLSAAASAQTVVLSEKASMTITPGATETTRNIIYQLRDPQKSLGENAMLVIFPEYPDPTPIEVAMLYDEKTQSYTASYERPKEVGELFLITDAKEVGAASNPQAATLEQGFLALKEGKQQPVNEVANTPKGKLKTMLMTKEGKLQETSETDKKTLKEGERFVQIYTPPNYNPERQLPYKIQITLDGRQYLWPMRMNVVLDNLTNNGEIEPVVSIFISPDSGPPKEEAKGFQLVMPKGYGLSMRLKEYCCNPDFADLLARIPQSLRTHFNVTQDPKETTLWGVSAGGLQASYTALLHPEVFGNVVAESPMAWNIPSQNGENWREGIVDIEDENGNDISWTTATAPLPDQEGEHNEYLSQIVKMGHDPISGRTLDPSNAINFYLDAGEREQEYHPKEGTANLAKAAELFAEAVMEKGHSVVDQAVHILSNGGHYNMTWMRNLAQASKAIHAPVNQLQKYKEIMAKARQQSIEHECEITPTSSKSL